MHTASISFRTVTTRGFVASGNNRFNQLIDGMDNQAPGLNFSVGNIVGLTEPDVDNMELLQGASSALYGSGGMNGTLLINSKNPFKYQGLSFEIKQGMMHTDGKERPLSPFYDWAIRWGKKINDRWAFKLSAQYLQAQDWEAQDYSNLERNNVFSSPKAGDRTSDPNYDGVNVFGDEASANVAAFGTAGAYQVVQGIKAQTGIDFGPILNTLPANASIAQITGLIGSILGPLPPPVQQALLNPLTQGALFTVAAKSYSAVNVSRTGYEEKYLVDYNTYNLKLNGGISYKISNNVEANLQAYWGTGTTVYTGADRYAIKNLKMGQYKLEFRGKNWFVRAYTVQENSGDAYTATTAALFINRAWKPDADWFGQYTGTYTAAKASGVPDIQAHNLARTAADNGRFLPGTSQYQDAFQNAKNTTIGKGGAKFDDRTDMYHYEGQLNLTEQVKFAETLVGASYRQFRLNSHGIIFADTAGVIPISEFGAYIQLQRWLINDRLKLTLSGR